MTWWTSVPGLTPVAAYDAGRVSGVQLLDGVGSNHITATSTLTFDDFDIKRVAGNGNPMAFTTPIPVPATGVIAGFWSPKRRHILLTKAYADTSAYMLHLSDNGNGWYAANANTGAPYGLYGSIGQPYFVAMVTRGTDSVLYVDGNLVGVPVSASYTMSQIGQVGYGANGNEYNLDTDEHLYALGVWSGAATQADVQALEAAARFALAGTPGTYRGFGSSLGVLGLCPPNPALPNGLKNIGFQIAVGQGLDMHFGGFGKIMGTVKNAPASPVQRRVVLIDDSTQYVIRQTFSDPLTGAYAFTRIAMGRSYTVLSFDHTQSFRAVVADRVVPELMP